MNLASTARRKSKVKSQKSKVLWNKLFRAFQWSAYLRRAVLDCKLDVEQLKDVHGNKVTNIHGSGFRLRSTHLLSVED